MSLPLQPRFPVGGGQIINIIIPVSYWTDLGKVSGNKYPVWLRVGAVRLEGMEEVLHHPFHRCEDWDLEKWRDVPLSAQLVQNLGSGPGFKGVWATFFEDSFTREVGLRLAYPPARARRRVSKGTCRLSTWCVLMLLNINGDPWCHFPFLPWSSAHWFFLTSLLRAFLFSCEFLAQHSDFTHGGDAGEGGKERMCEQREGLAPSRQTEVLVPLQIILLGYCVGQRAPGFIRLAQSPKCFWG